MKTIASANNSINQIRKDIFNINKQITDFYDGNSKNRDKAWLKKAMFAKNKKRLKIKSLERWLRENSKTKRPDESSQNFNC